MKAIIHKKYGNPDVLQLAEVAKPAPRAGEVLVKIRATAVNQADNHLLSGTMRFSTGLLRPKQPILGADIAGRVAAVRPDATRFQVGDAVFGDLSAHGRGGFAEYVAAPQEALARMPDTISFAAAAAVPLTGVTALQGLRDQGGLQPGDRVLINGASGGVGSFAVQIAKALGGEVTAVVSTAKMETVRRIGADHVIDYTAEDFTQSEKQYDLIFDTVGSRGVGEVKRVLVENGRFVTTVFLPALAIPWLARTEGRRMINLMARPNGADLALLGEMLVDGRITPVIDRCYPLSETPEALRYLGRGHARGKVVVMVKGG